MAKRTTSQTPGVALWPWAMARARLIISTQKIPVEHNSPHSWAQTRLQGKF
jgi:hypothetical protein